MPAQRQTAALNWDPENSDQWSQMGSIGSDSFGESTTDFDAELTEADFQSVDAVSDVEEESDTSSIDSNDIFERFEPGSFSDSQSDAE